MTAPARTRESRHSRRVQADASKDLAQAGRIWTEGQFAADLARGRWDIEFFAWRFLGIRTHPGQNDMFDAILRRDSSGWRPLNLDIHVAAGNRAGKTLGETIAHFHSAFYKLGSKPPMLGSADSLRKWVQSPYEWYHLAIAQETSELAYIELARILQGVHEAQHNGCPLVNELGPQVVDMSKKFRSEYLWTQIHPVFGGGQIHYRTTGEKAIGSLGKDMNGISYDEAGFDPHFAFVVSEVLHMRRLSTGGQMWIVGTSTEGITAFADKWEEGNPASPDKQPGKMSIRISTRQNIGYGIDQEMFDRLVAGMPEALVPQNIDGFFLEARSSFFSQQAVDEMFVDGLPEITPAVPGHHYVQGADPALTYDSTWSIVLDVTGGNRGAGVYASRVRGRTTGPVIAAAVMNAHRAYDGGGYTCATGIDSTGFGGAMFRDLLPIPVRSIEFGGTRGRKLKLLNDLKSAIEKKLLVFPRTGIWLALRRQLLGYRLDDRKLETDAVMALAVAWSMAKISPSAMQAQPFDYFNTGPRRVSSAPSGPPLVTSMGRRAVVYSSMSDMNRRTRSG